jgi:hypothetical protein
MSTNARARSLPADLARLEETLRDTVAEQPALALGAAVGIGFLLGGGLSRGALTVLLGVGTRMAGAWLQQEFLERADAQENEQ